MESSQTGRRKSKNSILGALVLNDSDNVATAARQVAADEEILVHSPSGSSNLTISEFIDTGHKIALTNIRDGEPIIKFGEVIGEATKEIESGDHVHTHNMKSLHGRPIKPRARN